MPEDKPKSIFKFFGIRLKFVEETDRTIITWSRMNALDIILCFVVLMGGMFGIASALNWEEIWGTKIIPFNTTGTIIFWCVWVLITIHVLFNRATKLVISKYNFRFKKRPLFPIVHQYATKDIMDMQMKLKKVYHESDIGYYPDTYNFRIFFRNGKKVKLDSFNKKNSKQIMSKIQEYREI